MGYFKEVNMDYVSQASSETVTMWEMQVFNEACKLSQEKEESLNWLKEKLGHPWMELALDLNEKP